MVNQIGLDYLSFCADRCKTHRELEKWHDGALAMLITLIHEIPTEIYDNLKSQIDNIYLDRYGKIL